MEAAALSWAESGRSALRLNLRQLCLCGALPLGRRPAFAAYTLFAFCLGLCQTAESLLACYCSWGRMEQATKVLMTTFNIGGSTAKMALFVLHRRRYWSLVRRTDLLVAEGAPTADSPKRPALELPGPVAAARRRAARLTAAMLLLIVAQYVTWFPMPLVVGGGGGGERLLPLVQHPWDNNRHHYALSYALQCMGAAWTTQVSFGIDCLFVTILMLVVAQMEVLASRVQAIRVEPLAASGATEKASDQMYAELCLCVDIHQKILSFVKQLESTMSPIVITQFAISVLVACVSLFPATYSTNFTDVLLCAGFLPVPLGELYLYCWAAHNLTQQAEAVSAAAYGCSWVEASERFKRALRILISRAQKPLVLTAGRLYPINRAAFVSLVNASYSYYALLGQINSRSTDTTH